MDVFLFFISRQTFLLPDLCPYVIISLFCGILIPKKRFGMQVKIYFPEGSGEQIVEQLGNHLPMEEVKLDLLDKLVNFLRI